MLREFRDRLVTKGNLVQDLCLSMKDVELEGLVDDPSDKAFGVMLGMKLKDEHGHPQ